MMQAVPIRCRLLHTLHYRSNGVQLLPVELVQSDHDIPVSTIRLHIAPRNQRRNNIALIFFQFFSKTS